MIDQNSIPPEIMDIAVSIEKDIPSRVTGANRVFIRAVVARAILAERERCAQRVLSYAGEAGEQNDPPEIRHLSAIVRAIRAGTPCR